MYPVHKQIEYLHALPESEMHNSIINSLELIMKSSTKYHAFQAVEGFCNFHKIKQSDLQSSSRKKQQISDARKVLSFILQAKYKLSLNDIGSMLNRDHSSILHAIRSHHNLMKTDKSYREKYMPYLEYFFPETLKKLEL